MHPNKYKRKSENDVAGLEMYHGLFDVFLIIVATGSVVITVNNLNSYVTLGKTRAPFTCENGKVHKA